MLSEVIIDNELNLKPECIFSCDETILNLNKNTQKVIVPKTLRNAHSRNVSSSEHTTIHVCVNAAGNAIPLMIIFKASMPGGKYSDQGPEQALYGKSKSGFMDGELFVKWFELLFVPKARPSPQNPVLLLLDGHASHCTVELIDCAKRNNVILFALPPHTTHLCQPLDVAVFKSLKNEIARTVREAQLINSNLWISKRNVAKMLRITFEKSMNMSNIKKGYEKCGIHHFNPNAIDKSRLDLPTSYLISQPATTHGDSGDFAFPDLTEAMESSTTVSVIDEQEVDEEHYIINIWCRLHSFHPKFLDSCGIRLCLQEAMYL